MVTPQIMCEGIGSYPRSSPLFSLCLCPEEWNLQLIDINSAQDLWLEKSRDLGESRNLIRLGRIDSPPT